jgi:ParB family chromosome partitioning protein
MALGGGLEDLLAQNVESGQIQEEGVWEVDPKQIVPSSLQPRKRFEPGALESLARSIREHGILQPVSVRRHPRGYELIAGERRWRAALEAKLPAIPIRVFSVDDNRLLEWALVENLQREDLNPIEKGEGLTRLQERSGWTQQQLAERVGLDRATIANLLRLLGLPGEVQELLKGGTIAMGHARALLGLPDAIRQVTLSRRIQKDGLSVREVEEIVSAAASAGARKPHPRRGGSKSAQILALEDRLRRSLGCKVEIVDRSGRGRIQIPYTSSEDFQRIFDRLTREPGGA